MGKIELSQLSAVNRLFDIERKIAVKALEFRFKWVLSPERIDLHLRGLSPDTLAQIENGMAMFLHCLELCSVEQIDPWNDNEFFQLTMHELGLTYPSDFLKLIHNDDIIETYDMHRRQTFRNMRFMEISTYSLMEVLSYDWPMLFERPSHITRLIIDRAEQDMWKGNRTVESHIPKHYIREILSGKPQVCEVQHRYFAPLFSGPNSRGGIISVCKGKTIVIEMNLSEDNVSFI